MWVMAHPYLRGDSFSPSERRAVALLAACGGCVCFLVCPSGEQLAGRRGETRKGEGKKNSQASSGASGRKRLLPAGLAMYQIPRPWRPSSLCHLRRRPTACCMTPPRNSGSPIVCRPESVAGCEKANRCGQISSSLRVGQMSLPISCVPLFNRVGSDDDPQRLPTAVLNFSGRRRWLGEFLRAPFGIM